jgi:hypothetical protein
MWQDDERRKKIPSKKTACYDLFPRILLSPVIACCLGTALSLLGLYSQQKQRSSVDRDNGNES